MFKDWLKEIIGEIPVQSWCAENHISYTTARMWLKGNNLPNEEKIEKLARIGGIRAVELREIIEKDRKAFK